MELKHLPEEIKSERLILRKHELKNASLMFSYIDEDRERLRQFLPWVDFTKAVADTEEFIDSSNNAWEKGEQFGYSIFDQASDTYIGNIGLVKVSWKSDSAEIGYWVLGKFEGKGLISAAVSALEKSCFEVGFNRIEIRCSSLNEKSAGVPKRLGYRLDGILRQDKVENDDYRDTLVFSKLKSESLG